MNFPRQRDSPRSSSSWISFDVNVINLSKSLKMYRYILLLGVLKRVYISLPALTDVTKDSLQFESKFCKTRDMSTSVPDLWQSSNKQFTVVLVSQDL